LPNQPLNDPLASFIVNRCISSTDSSWNECFENAKMWARACMTNHEMCDRGQIHPLPTRLLDLRYSNTSEKLVGLCLYESKGESGNWVALSHCWGKSQPLKATTLNQLSLKANIPWSTFLPLYQDAITWTRKLGFRYLWIDSLCISQNSHEDWANESARMGNVYKQASITIAAEAMDCCEKSFFGQGNIDRGRERGQTAVSCLGSKRGLKGKISFPVSTKASWSKLPQSSILDTSGAGTFTPPCNIKFR
jgi:hypothetical protein